MKKTMQLQVEEKERQRDMGGPVPKDELVEVVGQEECEDTESVGTVRTLDCRIFVIGKAAGQSWRGEKEYKELDGSRNIRMGEGAVGIEPRTYTQTRSAASPDTPRRPTSGAFMYIYLAPLHTKVS